MHFGNNVSAGSLFVREYFCAVSLLFLHKIWVPASMYKGSQHTQNQEPVTNLNKIQLSFILVLSQCIVGYFESAIDIIILTVHLGNTTQGWTHIVIIINNNGTDYTTRHFDCNALWSTEAPSSFSSFNSFKNKKKRSKPECFPASMPMCSSSQRHACVLACLAFQSSVSMELRRLGQTSGSVGRELWVNFKLPPPSRRRRPPSVCSGAGCPAHV